MFHRLRNSLLLPVFQLQGAIMTTKNIIKNQTISNTDLTFLLNKRAKELNITVPKCATCKNPCSSCKIKFLKKEFKLNAQKPAITSSIEAFKTKRKLEKFWG